MMPTNLPLLVGMPNHAEAVEKIMRGEGSLEDQLVSLRDIRIKVWFSKPVEIRIAKKPVTEYTFAGFFKARSYGLCYFTRRKSHSGYPLGDLINLITRWEPVIEQEGFKSYDQFKAKFDLNFITEDEIKKLWNSKSAQHGGQYRPNDFRRLSRYGQYVLKSFLDKFAGLGKVGPYGYGDSSDGKYKIVSAQYDSSNRHQGSHFGRDISISYSTCLSYIYYSSEFPGSFIRF